MWAPLAVLLALAACSGEAPPDTPARLRRFAGLPGPEDLAWDAARSRAIVSCDPRLEPGAEGFLAALDPVSGRVTRLPREGAPPGPFHPHGIDLQGEQLWVVVHGSGPGGPPHEIQRYRVDADHLRFEAAYRSPLLRSPNDVAGEGEGFWVSNDRGRAGPGPLGALAGGLELALGLRGGSVLRWRAGQWGLAARGIAMANGLLRWHDRLLVAATREDAVLSFPVGPGGELGRPERYPLPGPDNLSPGCPGEEGDWVLVAGHPSLLAIALHLREPSRPAPSRVYRIEPASGRGELLFADSGERVPGASVALCPGEPPGALLLGQIVGEGVYLVEPGEPGEPESAIPEPERLADGPESPG